MAVSESITDSDSSIFDQRYSTVTDDSSQQNS